MSSIRIPFSTADIVRLFQQAEQDISQEYGQFKLFGLFERIDIPGKYDVVMSASWLRDDADSMNLIFNLVHASIGNDNWFSKIGIFVIVPEQGPFVAAVREALPEDPIQHGMKRITNFFYDSEIIRDAIIITSVEPEAKPEKPKRKPRTAEPVAV